MTRVPHLLLFGHPARPTLLLLLIALASLACAWLAVRQFRARRAAERALERERLRREFATAHRVHVETIGQHGRLLFRACYDTPWGPGQADGATPESAIDRARLNALVAGADDLRHVLDASAPEHP